MKRVLLANIPPSVANWLELRLGGLQAVAAEGLSHLGQIQDDGTWNLTILQEFEGAYSSRDMLERLRRAPGAALTPILYILNQAPEPARLRELVESYALDRVMVHPVDPDELLREVSRILKLTPSGPLSSPADDAIRQLWEKFRPLVEAQLQRLEDAGLELLEGRLSPETADAARRNAHQLAGSLGTYGYPRGSELAARLEALLADIPGPDEAREYSDLVVRLRQSLAGQPEFASAPVARAVSRDVLVLDAPGAALEIPTQGRDFRLVRVQHPGQAQQQLSQLRPVAILAHLGVHQEHAGRLAFLREASERHPDLPLVAFVPGDTLEQRVEAIRNGAQRILDSKLSPGQLGALLASVLQTPQTKTPRVLVLDADKVAAFNTERALTQAGILVECLHSTGPLLELLHRFRPDLVVMDSDLPVMSGFEICRLLRGMPRWQVLPIVLTASYPDSATVVRAFEVGADDFVAKPCSGAELVARIHSRLERARHLVETAATDPVTGLPAWVRGGPRLRGYLHLARRWSKSVMLGMLEIDALEQSDPRRAESLQTKLGQMLLNRFRGEDTVCHFQGDRLLVGLFGAKRSDAVERLNQLLYKFVEETGGTFCAGCSVFPGDGESVEGLLHVAERALQKAREAGPGHVVAKDKTYSVSPITGRTRVDVALVDDDGLLGPLLLHALEKRGYSTLWIQDGLEAGRRLASGDAAESARVMLLDVDLPGQSGYALLRQLSEAKKLEDTRVLMLTARANQKDVLTGLELGAVDHVSKPFTLPVLLEKVRLALQS